jgi:hypothetical protein
MSSGGLGNVPTTWSVVQTGDYNGDGRSDLLWRDSSGNTAIHERNECSVISGSRKHSHHLDSAIRQDARRAPCPAALSRKASGPGKSSATVPSQPDVHDRQSGSSSYWMRKDARSKSPRPPDACVRMVPERAPSAADAFCGLAAVWDPLRETHRRVSKAHRSRARSEFTRRFSTAEPPAIVAEMAKRLRSRPASR